MSHPYKKYAEDKVGKSRASEMTRGYKRGGAVTININTKDKDPVLPTGGLRPPPPLPVPPGPMAGGPSVPPPGAGPFARGGAVKMTAGAETGKGRLQKAAAQKRK